MNSTRLFAAIIATLAVFMLVGTGVALTTYTATNTTNSSSVPYDGNTVDIVDNNGTSLGQSLTISRATTSLSSDNVLTIYDADSPDGKKVTVIQNYKLRIHLSDSSASPVVRCYIHLDDPRSWVIIDSITLNINNTDYNIGISPALVGSQIPAGVSSLPTDAITGLSSGNDYSFTVTIRYVNNADDPIYLYNIPQTNGDEVTYNTEDAGFLDLTGSTITFLMGDSDPLST